MLNARCEVFTAVSMGCDAMWCGRQVSEVLAEAAASVFRLEDARIEITRVSQMKIVK